MENTVYFYRTKRLKMVKNNYKNGNNAKLNHKIYRAQRNTAMTHILMTIFIIKIKNIIDFYRTKRLSMIKNNYKQAKYKTIPI